MDCSQSIRALSAETAGNRSHDCVHIAPIHSSRLQMLLNAPVNATDDIWNAGEAASTEVLCCTVCVLYVPRYQYKS